MNDSQPIRVSVLERLAADGVSVPSVRLGGGDPAGPPAVSLRRTGRYEILGGIARGGVGRILRGRDVDLNRDVALKVLRKRHAGDPELVRRFVEEAQVGGQLSHPGILPVYELGLLGSDRPYFAMKLVKGDSLAAHLAARRSPAEDGGRFLSQFLQVCQAVAYAHSRGVIHRDLKPANVMIGAYGEVLVVDWGFAKVLARGGVADERRARIARSDVTRIATIRSGSGGSDSLPGSVMGTPAYMPPEQALGQLEELDERSDVFALGGILLEILTGEAVYVSGDGDPLVLAAGCRTGPARKRLAAAGADPALADLVTRSLSPLKRDRPRDAGVLARAVREHLVSVEARERRARLESANARAATAAEDAKAATERAAEVVSRRSEEAARARAERAARRTEEARAAAEEARRLRRLTRLVAGAVAVLLVVSIGAYLSVRGHRRRAERTTAAAVADALDRAQALSGEGRHREALAVAAQAKALARAEPSTEQTRSEIESVLAGVREGGAAAERTRRRIADSRRLLDRLEDDLLAWRRPLGDREALAAVLRSFADHGIDLRAGARAASAIREREEASEDLLAFLDLAVWLAAVADEPAIHGDLVAAANAADPAERRVDLRRWSGVNEPEALLNMAAAVDFSTWSAPTVRSLSVALLARGRTREACEFLVPAQMHHPSDLWLNYLQARALDGRDPPRLAMASCFYRAALALRPDSERLRADVARTENPTDVLTAFRGRHGWRDRREWLSFDVNYSAMTERRQRLYVRKAAVTKALIAWPSGVEHEDFEEPPLPWEPDTLFVSESVNPDGSVHQTLAYRIREDREPEFLRFTDRGRLSSGFLAGYCLKPLPGACTDCHGDPSLLLPPACEFPEEKTIRRFLVDEGCRDLEIVLRFREYYHGESPVMAPYAAIWLARLRSGAEAGTLSPEDAGAHAALKLYYPDILGE